MTRISVDFNAELYPVFVLETGEDATFGSFDAPPHLVEACRVAEAELEATREKLAAWIAEHGPEYVRADARSFLKELLA